MSRDGSNSVSTVLSLNCRQASRPLSLGHVSLLVVALHFARKTPSAQYVSPCEWIPFLLIMLTAAEESHHWICCHVEHVSSAFQIFATSSTAVVDPRLHRLQTAQQPILVFSLLGAIVDCFLLVAVGGYQPSLSFTHDAVPLTLNRSASPAKTALPHVNTEPSGARFTASKLKVIGCTVMIPGFPRRYRWIHLMFLMSMSLSRP